jgi:1-acyl-sn-glycerol-3-phosphate acyltransferase
MEKVHYPRHNLSRFVLRFLGRLLLSVLARVKIQGRENLPSKGPVILAGNHVAFLEVALMIIYPPYQVELIGTGDIPIEPVFAPLAHLYGYIPINRGNLDRKGLNQALSVLQQGGVLGIFPEGGIWQPGEMQVHTGIAWLSSQSQSPIVPIGFGGMRGAMQAMLHLKRPSLTMNIGELIPPIKMDRKDVSRKSALMDGAAHIIERIYGLIPEKERTLNDAPSKNHYSLQILVADPKSNHPNEVIVEHNQALAQLLMNPVLLNVFVRNLKLSSVKPLQDLSRPYSGEVILNAVESILDYLEINRGFLTYRFGIETGLAMQSGLVELTNIARLAASQKQFLQILPVSISSVKSVDS